MAQRKPLYFTFGNHMHWVDFEWLWGYGALPESIDDTLLLCAETGARGNLNFDGIGYEKLASGAPRALERLRAAIADGRLEVVGASYGQPYGLFHGGESNIRQRVFGLRAATLHTGRRPRAFWEEEFDFFPQLPQILARSGYRSASLFFQWTWHTPEVPLEEETLVHWEGVDGTRLPTLARTELCLHQWPEDFDGRLDSPLVRELERPAIVQWLELMPSPDWMCRSELLLPRLRELFADERFELRPRTLSEMVAELDRADAPVRRYGMDDVYHGVSLGKNGDHMVRLSLRAEEQLRAAESTSALIGLFGRPYPSWRVYPTWELDEAWRELLAAQHHDNHECEGLCGFVGERSFERSDRLSHEVLRRTLTTLARRVPAGVDELLACNPCGWPRDVHAAGRVARAVPPFGYALLGPDDRLPSTTTVDEDAERVTLTRGELSVTLDRASGCSVALTSPEWTTDLLGGAPLGALSTIVGGRVETFPEVETEIVIDEESGDPQVVTSRRGPAGEVRVTLSLARGADAVHLSIEARLEERPDGGVHAGLAIAFPEVEGLSRLVADTPYCVGEVRAERDHRRKYPSGDWMTSEQWFETVRRPFYAHSLVDLDGARGGLLILHDGSQSWLRTDEGVCCVLDLYDPWDEEHYRYGVRAELQLVPHAPMGHAQRWRLAREHVELPLVIEAEQGEGDLPQRFGALFCDAPGVAVTALYRECQRGNESLEHPFDPSVRDPYVLRLVELDGAPAHARVLLPGPVGNAALTNLMGEVEHPLEVHPAEAPWGGGSCAWHAVALDLGPHEIATVMVDLEAGHHVPRNLDEHRGVWATVHREEPAHGE